MESPKKGKRELISKANTTMVAVAGVGAFLIVFFVSRKQGTMVSKILPV